jgi:hypothetical protein
VSEVTLALGIPHTPWVPERVKSMARLREQIGVNASGVWPGVPRARYREFTDREPNHAWSARLWRWLAETGASHCLVLQDDVLIAPNFWPALRAMLEVVPGEVVGLEVVHPAAGALAQDGHKWFTTSEGLVGPGYVLPRELLEEFLRWRSSKLKPGAIEAITEDTLLCCWLLATGRKCWHPLPTLIDHDTSIASTYGNDGHANRRPRIRWDTAGGWGAELEQPGWWGDPFAMTGEKIRAPHLGRYYEAGQIPALCLKWAEGFGEAEYARAMRDDGRDVKRRLVLERRLADLGKDVPRVMLCTPVRGGVHPAYARSVWLASRLQDVELEQPFELRGVVQQQADVVRRRSQLVRRFLESDCTHLWFLDADVEVDPQALRGMLATGKDYVCTPYPRRDKFEWGALGEAQGKACHPEALAYHYAILLDEGAGKVEEDNTTAIAMTGLGCTLLSRACLERMATHYAGELTFLDVAEGSVPTVALFQLLLRDKLLMSEDFSFCTRWRDIGGTVWMYLGPGSPATHHGEHAYRGHIEAFGLKRLGE